MFKTEREYKTFRIWAIEGSTLGQRMQIGHKPEIPHYWNVLKPLADHMDLPETLAEFKALMDKTLEEEE